jgi:hypothetical protein
MKPTQRVKYALCFYSWTVAPVRLYICGVENRSSRLKIRRKN